LFCLVLPKFVNFIPFFIQFLGLVYFCPSSFEITDPIFFKFGANISKTFTKRRTKGWTVKKHRFSIIDLQGYGSQFNGFRPIALYLPQWLTFGEWGPARFDENPIVFGVDAHFPFWVNGNVTKY